MRVSLSGGGARSAFQAGVLDALIEGGVDINDILAVSGGVINGYLLKVHGVEEMRKFWLEVMPKRGKMGKWYWRIPLNVIRRKKGLMDPEFIMGLVRVYVKEIPENLSFDVVSLFDGNQITLSSENFVSLGDYQKGIYASMAIPILFPPVDIETDRGKVMDLSDGGLYYPLSRDTDPLDLKITTHYPDKDYGRVKGVLDSALKVSGFRRDDALDQLFMEPNKIEPEQRLPGVWDWREDSLMFSYYHGMEQGRNYLKKIE